MKTMFQTWLVSSAALLVMVAALAHARSSVPPNSNNAFGAVMYQDNPNQYLMGNITKAGLFHDGKRVITTLSVAPTNTYTLFSQQVAFCGNQAEKINDHTAVVVFTYSKVMHQKDCYDLYRVDDMDSLSRGK
jgi:hypothetical protein